MKVLLLQDVAHLGQKGDIKEVNGGYARNFLFVQNLAKPATSQVMKEAEHLKKERERAQEAQNTAFKDALDKAKDVKIIIEAKVNEQGGLFRAISARQIMSALAKLGIEEIKEEDLQIAEPIKKVGEHKLKIKREKLEGEIKLEIKSK